MDLPGRINDMYFSCSGHLKYLPEHMVLLLTHCYLGMVQSAYSGLTLLIKDMAKSAKIHQSRFSLARERGSTVNIFLDPQVVKFAPVCLQAQTNIPK